MIDLHIHSNLSDGKLTVEEIFQYSKENNLNAISITDHDNIDNIETSIVLSKKNNITYIPGIEISCSFNDYDDIHLLGYFIDHNNLELKNYINLIQENRKDRNLKIIENANNNGYFIDINELLEFSKKELRNIGKPDIAEYLIHKKYFSNFFEVFKKYLDNINYKHNFVRKNLPISEAIRIISQAGGITVLAHPFHITNDHNSLETLIKEFVNIGINGLETYYNNYSNKQIKFLKKKAKEGNMVISGGSDFHNFELRNTRIGYYNNFKEIPDTILDNILIRFPCYEKYAI